MSQKSYPLHKKHTKTSCFDTHWVKQKRLTYCSPKLSFCFNFLYPLQYLNLADSFQASICIVLITKFQWRFQEAAEKPAVPGWRDAPVMGPTRVPLASRAALVATFLKIRMVLCILGLINVEI